MEWILAPKAVDETTADDFSDLIKQKFTQRVKTGGLNLLAGFQARTTGFANVNLEKELDKSIETNSQQTQANIKRL